MNWLNAIKKNDSEFNNYIEKKEIIIPDKKVFIIDLNIKDPDEEFELLYNNKIIDLKLEFLEIINHEGLPFLNNKKILNNIYNKFFDFIKYNSKNYDNVIKNVEKQNIEYLNQTELSDEENLNNDTYDFTD
jgi:hypothetical protein